MDSIDKFYCIRFIRLPPATVQLNVPFELALSLTDDVGSPGPGFGQMNLRLQCFVDEYCLDESADLVVVAPSTNIATFSIDSLSSTFHSFKAVVKQKQTQLKTSLRSLSFRIAVSLDAKGSPSLDRLGNNDLAVAKLVALEAYAQLESGDNAFILRACSGSIRVAPAFIVLPKDKVRTTEVFLYPPFKSRPLCIVERPSMHVIGDHLWHSSIALASYILNTKSLFDEAPYSSDKLFVELGAGCGLLSLAISCLLQSQADRSQKIIATDLPEIVETTLADTLAANPDTSSMITKQALRWGQDRNALPPVIQNHDGDLIILASDVLYNAQSHLDILRTLLVLFRNCKKQCEAYITYKYRVEGDNGFFDLARQAGLSMSMICKIADIEIWKGIQASPKG